MYGADAVFIGGKQFSLRARASNFGIQEIKEACEFAHKHGKKIYVTTNIIPHNDNIDGLDDYLIELERVGVDAIICASPVVIDTAKKHTNLEVHISTQMSLTNHYSVNFWQSEGVKRVVLARELSKDELRVMRENTTCDLEVFIHGGMCVSYSGRCTLSNNLTDRDANRGGCAHSCRWNYDLYDGNTKLNDDMYFSMSSKDLQTVHHISDLIDIGIDSLKIEGRMKSIHYIATVVHTYRHLIDSICDDMDVDLPRYLLEIKKAENRLSSHGFMDGMTTIHEQLYNLRSEQPTQEFIGLVIDYNPNTLMATVEQRNKFVPGDEVEVFSPSMEKLKFKVETIWDEDGTELDAARHPKQHVKVLIPFPVHPYDMIRKL
ncbi:U32 family peptidase [Candidatus Xianfuyuplasma coldseepsis]|uniref:U32 family peptidase n=2 Tax=Candidatus Xianfuyuplasma coldseepsis TaxID=2782163 RepID=A0A7L7KTS0_9MOLU|nr:U32 family peptidase [Xianfuyuplasma coldseepsis]